MANDTPDAAFQQADYVPSPDYFPSDTFPSDFIGNSENFIIYDERIPPIDLTIPNSQRNQNHTTNSNAKNSSGKPIRLVLEPKLRKSTTIQSFAAIYQDAAGITVARFSADNWRNDIKIDAWAHYKTATFGVKNPCQISQHLANIVQQLPVSDIYLIDDHVAAQRFRKSVTPKKLEEIVQINQQCAILVALLHHKKRRICNEDDQPNVFFMRYQAVGQLFNLFVGNEPISTQSTIKNILHGDFCSDALESSKVDISEEIKRTYHKSYPVERECLGRSMLIGLTFIRLGLFKS